MIVAEKIPWLRDASRQQRWLVGVSGGADSVALLHLLIAAGLQNLVVCHLNHGLRGRAATEDAKFVRRLAGRFGLDAEFARVDVGQRMRERGESMETAARNERHTFFAVCADKHQCPQILLAHHADDQAETVLWNLLRGSHGLKGMHPQNGLVVESGPVLELIRPLLGVRHAELVAWLQFHGHRWREDASNAQPIAIRNRLRNEALPLLAEISGRDAVAALSRGAVETEELRALEGWALEQARVLDPQGRLHLPVLRKLPVALQRLAVRKFLQDHRVNSLDRDLIERSLSLLDVCSPAVMNLPGGGKMRRSEGRLWLEI